MSSGLVDSDNWRPIGIQTLEPEAMDAVRAVGNTLVTAGPAQARPSSWDNVAYICCKLEYAPTRVEYLQSALSAMRQRTFASASNAVAPRSRRTVWTR